MVEKKLLVRSFSRQEQKILACGAFISCFIMAINLCTILKPYLGRLPDYLQVVSINPIIYNFSNSRSDVYEINGNVRVHGISSTIFIASNHDKKLSSWNIRPYPRKMDTAGAMKRVTNFKIIMEDTDRIPHCSRDLSIPAILFSTSGHAGNHFHAFTDIFIPLFLTTHQFNRKIMFLMSNQNSKWIAKYRLIFEKLTDYDIYDIDKENEVLCFSRIIVGLKAHKDMEIDPSQYTNFSTRNFTKFLRSAFSLERESVHDRHQINRVSQPRLLIISRQNSRQLMNDREIGNTAQSLGFDVALKKLQWNLSLVAQLVNSFDVMVGVHGAGLTNMVFLPENAVVIQIIPFGLDHFAKICFEYGAESMNLKYLKYKVSLNESSLLGKYSLDSEVYRNPRAISKKGFDDFANVYLDNQDVNLDLDRFRKTLLRALELVGT